MQKRTREEFKNAGEALRESSKKLVRRAEVAFQAAPADGVRLTILTDIDRAYRLERSNFFTGLAPLALERRKHGVLPPRLLAKPVVVESSVELLRLGLSVPVQISTERHVLKLQTGTSTELIDFADITHILRHYNEVQEIIANHRSIALKYAKPLFDVAPLEPFLSHLRFDARSPEKLKATKQRCTEKWLARELSSFRYILKLNAISSRSFHTPSLYPIFPTINTDFTECNDDTVWQDLVIEPEHYFDPGKNGDPVVIYHNRKELERREDLHLWIERVFGIDGAPHRRLFRSHLPREPRLPDLPTRLSSLLPESGNVLFANALSHGSFSCILSSNHVLFITPLFEERTRNNKPVLKIKVTKSYNVNLTAGSRFFASKSTLVIADVSSLIILTAHKKFVYPDCTIRSWSDGVAQLSDYDLATLSTNGEWRPFTTLSERIICFGSSTRFHFTAAACDDCAVRFRSNTTGRKITTVYLEGDYPERVTITSRCGFVVVQCIAAVWVFTNAGIPFRKVAVGPSGPWFAFTGPDNADFIAEVATNGHGRCWEVGDPENSMELQIGVPIAALGFSSSRNCFLAVVKSDRIVAIPRKSE
jgi:hypothetical protein